MLKQQYAAQQRRIPFKKYKTYNLRKLYTINLTTEITLILKGEKKISLIYTDPHITSYRRSFSIIKIFTSLTFLVKNPKTIKLPSLS